MTNPIPADAEHYLDEYDAERFWAHVSRDCGTPYASDPLATASGQCWLWNGGVAEDYGRHRVFGVYRQAHELAFLDTGHRIAEGQELDHLCRIRSCVNPDHLEAVTHLENMRRGAKANQAHCVNGHEFSVENTLMRAGTRHCRTCRAGWAKKYRSNAA